MKFSYRLDASPQFVPFSRQQLLGMHALINGQKIGVEKSQSLFQQIEALDSTIDDHAYTQSLRRYRGERRLPLMMGLLFIVAALSCGVATLAAAEGGLTSILAALPFDAQSLLHGLSTLTAGLFVAFALAHFYVRARAARLTGKGLSRWWVAILQRWNPEFLARHDISRLAPDAIAQLVAVHYRIQDVDLDLTPSTREPETGETTQ
ncbi:DUF6097 family protein [Bordetella sp. 15P40C-2]|uniref:DUF6097 family protein n=1 Tax=Bordetella sp. 15P40C-2 TaxID=2572246 RepID=UPI001321AAD4|nr:DUF6097 family protein [Bordetella sp. 15P40C-2]MVW73530.1 hypothetical protein [Bordetella sp. 15P40C-2]